MAILLFYLPVAKCLILCLQERPNWIITNIFVFGKSDFQISVRICKAKFYFLISVLWYIGFGFMQKIWSIFSEVKMEINIFISDIKNILLFLRNDILWNDVF